MESKTNAPSFTVSLRGYDRMEVDEYLDSLAEALGQVEVAEEKSRGLQAHIDRLNARIADLEERIRSDIPKTGAVLGERISILLRSAEETAADTVNRAEAIAAEMLEKARDDVASAEDQARGAVARGEEQGRRIEAAARAEAAEIIAEAEGRASTRTRQIEQWAEQVISHTRAEEARMLAEQQEKRDQAEAELRVLIEQRDAVAASIAELRESLGQALGLVNSGKAAALGARVALGAASATAAALPNPVGATAGTGDEADADGRDDPEEAGAGATAGTEEAVAEADWQDAGSDQVDGDGADSDEEMPWPAAFRPLEGTGHVGDAGAGGDEDLDDTDRTGQIELRDLPEDGDQGSTSGTERAGYDEHAGDEDDEFETKLEAWVSGAAGPRHFRRL